MNRLLYGDRAIVTGNFDFLPLWTRAEFLRTVIDGFCDCVAMQSWTTVSYLY